jgi:hypothetical protein
MVVTLSRSTGRVVGGCFSLDARIASVMDATIPAMSVSFHNQI